MSVKVVEALQSETGGKAGAAGDQTGKEIVQRDFKNRSYSFTVCLRCLDREMASEASEWAKSIAASEKFGYSQEDRWEGAKAIERAGNDIGRAVSGDFDCSSLVLECYRLAGLPIKMSGYTGNMGTILLNTGEFKEVPEVLSDMEYAQIGDVLIAPGVHTLLIVSDGSKETYDDQETGEDIQYVRVVGNNVRVRSGPGKTYETVLIAHKGDRFPYYDTDEETGWYWIYTDCGICCITGKKRYTELI